MGSTTSRIQNKTVSLPPGAPMMHSQRTTSVSNKDVMISYSHQDMDYMRKMKGKNVPIFILNISL